MPNKMLHLHSGDNRTCPFASLMNEPNNYTQTLHMHDAQSVMQVHDTNSVWFVKLYINLCHHRPSRYCLQLSKAVKVKTLYSPITLCGVVFCWMYIVSRAMWLTSCVTHSCDITAVYSSHIAAVSWHVYQSAFLLPQSGPACPVFTCIAFMTCGKTLFCMRTS